MMRRFLPFAILGFMLFAAAQAAWADGEIRTIALHHRSAEEMIPIIRPLVEPDGTVTGTGYTLIVRTSDERFEQIQMLLRELDFAPRQLLITVRQPGVTSADSSGLSARGRIEGGSGRAAIGDGSRRDEGASVGIAGENGRVEIHAGQENRTGSQSVAHSMRALEGQWSRISAGSQVPYRQQQIYRNANGVIVQETVEFQDVSSGFEVRPRISGQQVTLDIRPFKNRLADPRRGTIDTQEVSTTVTGRLGEWLQIGGFSEQSSGTRRGILSSEREASSSSGEIFVKVELAPR